MRRLPRLVAETPVNKTVAVLLWRKRAETTVQVKVGRLDESDQQLASTEGVPKKTLIPESSLVKTLGMTLSGITPELKEKYSLGDDAKGVVVVDVAKNSSAADKGFQAGDLIMEAAQEEVKNPEDLAGQDRRSKKVRAQIDPAAGAAPGRPPLYRIARRSGLMRARHCQRRSRGDKFSSEVSLGVEQAGQIRVIETVACRGGNKWLGMESDAESGSVEHRQVVRAVADRDDVSRARDRVRRQAPAISVFLVSPVTIGGSTRPVSRSSIISNRLATTWSKPSLAAT